VATASEITKACRERMRKAVGHLQEEFGGIRTGRASPAQVEKIMVDYYGSQTPLQQLAGFSVPEPRTLLVQPYDKGSMKAIEKAIQQSDLGINPGNDGQVIRLVFPQLTEERRKDFIKIAHRKAEDARISIRSVRRHAKDELDRLAKDGEVGEDDVTRAEKELEKVTQKNVASIDELLKHKEAELLEV
jgi:ribosome recycling factor